jgi:hypothetical protein
MIRESPKNGTNLFPAPNAEERRFEHELTMTGLSLVAKLITIVFSGFLHLLRLTVFAKRRGREIVTRQNMGRIWFRFFMAMVAAWFVGFYVGHHIPGGTLGPWFMAFLFMVVGPLFVA